MLNRRTLLGLLAASSLLARPAFAAAPAIYAENGIAIDGSDAVAYFDGNGPVAGDAAFALTWQGAEWRFSSAENLAKFEADPESYAPQYGGYCAYAVSKGYTASTDPNAWSLHEGKLYLNYSRPVRLIWSRDIPGNIALADGNWPDVLAA